MAFQDFYELLKKNDNNISFIQLLQKYLTFWEYLYYYCGIKIDLINLGIFEMFDIYMYKGIKFLTLLFSLFNQKYLINNIFFFIVQRIYFVSNLIPRYFFFIIIFDMFFI